MNYQHAAMQGSDEELDDFNEAQEGVATFKRTEKKVGRNDPCHCGSNKKYKNCHGKL
jgi:preprotein translocase subunit SecA